MARSTEDDVADLLGEYRPDDRESMKRRLLVWIANGKTISAFCRQRGTPCVTTVYNWVERDPAFEEDFRRAKAVGYDLLAQECLDIADHGDERNVRHRKLRIWTRLQLLARWDSKRYGDKILVGGDGGEPIRVMDDRQVMQEVMGLLATAKARQLRATVGRELLN